MVAVLCSAVVAFAGPEKATASFKVIVNEANPVTEMTASEISKAFLRKKRTWPDGKKIDPVVLKTQDPARRAFTRAIHGRSVKAVIAYWQQQVFAGRGVPPVELSGDDAVLAYVRNHAGAIGYVSAHAHITALKEVAIK